MFNCDEPLRRENQSAMARIREVIRMLRAKAASRQGNPPLLVPDLQTRLMSFFTDGQRYGACAVQVERQMARVREIDREGLGLNSELASILITPTAKYLCYLQADCLLALMLDAQESMPFVLMPLLVRLGVQVEEHFNLIAPQLDHSRMVRQVQISQAQDQLESERDDCLLAALAIAQEYGFELEICSALAPDGGVDVDFKLWVMEGDDVVSEA